MPAPNENLSESRNNLTAIRMKKLINKEITSTFTCCIIRTKVKIFAKMELISSGYHQAL